MWKVKTQLIPAVCEILVLFVKQINVLSFFLFTQISPDNLKARKEQLRGVFC